MRTQTIMIVDDEPRTRQGLKRILETKENGHYEIVTADNGHAALELLEDREIDLIVTDIRMPEINGLHLIGKIMDKQLTHKPSVILISGYAEFDYAQQAIQLGVVNYLLKPISKEKFLSAVEQALEAGEERNRINMMSKIADLKLSAEEYSTVRKPVEDALLYVDEHLGQMFGLREVADHIQLNPSYFSALFKEQMHMNFSEYVTRRKLQRAKEMLLLTKLPIAEIAERVGYQTTKYFHKLFKEYEGCSPGQFRSEMLEPGTEIQK
ncbi:response regulator transcription factor [Cohnella herbarum]|uniref:Response regulator n=1 Tax=Cohnella herbarum TaxID=2728023 RepID=A0A7Z2ZQT1_9BACL|nr:response regulator [Cohnella herbarum]QJD87367.1 response regulator [Cohnella herbarum]